LPALRAGSVTANKGSMRTAPVNHSAGPLPDGCEPLRLISISVLLHYLAELARAATSRSEVQTEPPRKRESL
jgi:hypothetical protein